MRKVIIMFVSDETAPQTEQELITEAVERKIEIAKRNVAKSEQNLLIINDAMSVHLFKLVVELNKNSPFPWKLNNTQMNFTKEFVCMSAIMMYQGENQFELQTRIPIKEDSFGAHKWIKTRSEDVHFVLINTIDGQEMIVNNNRDIESGLSTFSMQNIINSIRKKL